MTIYMLHATHKDFGYVHKFVELFSTRERVTAYLKDNPNVKLTEVTVHEVDEA